MKACTYFWEGVEEDQCDELLQLICTSELFVYVPGSTSYSCA